MCMFSFAKDKDLKCFPVVQGIACSCWCAEAYWGVHPLPVPRILKDKRNLHWSPKISWSFNSCRYCRALNAGSDWSLMQHAPKKIKRLDLCLIHLNSLVSLCDSTTSGLCDYAYETHRKIWLGKRDLRPNRKIGGEENQILNHNTEFEYLTIDWCSAEFYWNWTNVKVINTKTIRTNCYGF